MTQNQTHCGAAGRASRSRACSTRTASRTSPAPAAGAYVKFFNFGVNAPGVNFYANDTKVTAISVDHLPRRRPTPDPRVCARPAIESTTGTAYGAAGNGGLYSSIAAGQYTFDGQDRGGDGQGSRGRERRRDARRREVLLVLHRAASTTRRPRRVDAFVVEDAFPATIDFTQRMCGSSTRVSNSQPMTLYAKNTTTGDSSARSASTVAYKSGGAFISVPAGVYDLTRTVCRLDDERHHSRPACRSSAAGCTRSRPGRRDRHVDDRDQPPDR